MPLVPPRLTVSGAQQPVRLQAVNVTVELTSGFARTTYEFAFHNPNARILEGNLEFPLLEGQVITGFALDLNGTWRDAVPVEKALGQQVFEDVTRAQVDPALLEVTRGNNYRVRVYPLAPRGNRRVRLEVTEPLRADGTLRLPLQFPDRPRLHLAVSSVSQISVTSFSGLGPVALTRKPDGSYGAQTIRTKYAGSGHLDIRVPLLSRPQTLIGRQGTDQYFLTVLPKPSAAPVAPRSVQSVDLIWDSSGSGARRNHTEELAVLDAYFRAFPDVEVRLFRLRDVMEPSTGFSVVRGDWRELRRELQATVYDGGTNFDALACSVQELCAKVTERLLFTDGLDTLGSASPGRSPVPLHIVNAAVSSDPARLNALAGRSNGVSLNLLGQPAGAAATQLIGAPQRLLEVDATGAAQITLREDLRYWYISGRLTSAEATLHARLPNGTVTQLALTPAAQGPFVAPLWAAWTVEDLRADEHLNRAEIRRLGDRFRLVTPGTSLLVLDRVEDYLRYDVTPPAQLRAEYQTLKQARDARNAQTAAEHLSAVQRMLSGYDAWWKRPFPKTAPESKPVPEAQGLPLSGSAASESPTGAVPPMMPAPVVPQNSRAAPAPSAAPSPSSSPAPAETGAVTVQLQKWRPDAPYAERLRAAATADLYRIYLDERPSYELSPAFYLDVADLLLERGLHDLGLRVLSNLAELELENRAVLRILAYRYMQAGHPELAIPVFQTVERLAPNEPQSYRDLGLAYAAAGNEQRAIETLYTVVRRSWDGRFPEVELLALNELNAIVSRGRKAVSTTFMDPRLKGAHPLDVRVVATWDADNTDLDMWVTDPNGDRVYYGAPLSTQGGQLSKDFTGGYGPEVFSLRDAKPGRYTIEMDYFGENQQLLSGTVTLQVKVITGFGTSGEREQLITLRLKDKKDQLLVGEFTVK
ncbi:VIT domain-containing protein [Deinococcus sp. QL22]|uniref:VIT domain-containing protein n=1 Tax=Deinococcus sp. QL22 TaxID=2939437 RepID=UPI002017A08E|nr:VIT domain-containing protein [Deinococcus sp. QL22]UQN08759.1 DUF2135 domain-containing protein [Deinococcus sp. QL22]